MVSLLMDDLSVKQEHRLDVPLVDTGGQLTHMHAKVAAAAVPQTSIPMMPQSAMVPKHRLLRHLILTA